MNKYHISPKTGRANICRATKQCPLGDNAAHFSSKEEAHDHIESELKKENFSFSTTSLATVKDIDELYGLPQDSSPYSVDEYLYRHLPKDYSLKESIEGPDYYNASLVSKGRNDYIIRTSGGPYSDFEVLQVSKVERATKAQISTTAKHVRHTGGDKEVNAMLKDVVKMSKEEVKKSKDKWPRSVMEDDGIRISYVGERTFTRPDGSKIMCFPIKAEGDRSFTDEPLPVAPSVSFEENGEKQNARRMDFGYMMFDTSTNKGVVLKYRAASDGSFESDYFKFNGGKLEAALARSWDEGKGSIFIVEGTGVKSAEYFKYA